jgi:hypothetical protein
MHFVYSQNNAQIKIDKPSLSMQHKLRYSSVVVLGGSLFD